MRKVRPLTTPRITIVSFLKTLLFVLRDALQSLCYRRDLRCLDERIFFLATTANHLHAVQPIINRLGANAVQNDSSMLTWINQRAALYCLPYLPLVLFRCITASSYQRSTITTGFFEYWLTYGQFLAACVLFSHRPRLVVLSNDHRPLPRSMALAARTLGIPTVFIPHAGVMEGLPPLAFDYAFLDGHHACSKYLSFGPSTTIVFLGGNCKLDPLLQGVEKQQASILVSPSFGDNCDMIARLLVALKEAGLSHLVTIRPHPRDENNEFYAAFARQHDFYYSDAARISSESDLRRAEFVICGDSNIILEARFAGCRVIVFIAGQQLLDRYGYVADGLPDFITDDVADIIHYFMSRFDLDHEPNAQLVNFIGTLGTHWHGHSCELIADTLLYLKTTGTVNESIWIPLEQQFPGNKVYSPVSP